MAELSVVEAAEESADRDAYIRSLSREDIERANNFARDWNAQWRRDQERAKMDPNLLKIWDKLDALEAKIDALMKLLRPAKPEERGDTETVKDALVDAFTSATRSVSAL